MKENSVIDGQITFEEIAWKQNIGRMTPKKIELLDLREKQFSMIERFKEEMSRNRDSRHLFLIKRGTVISSKEKYLFRGNLSQDVLALEDENCFELRPLIPEDKIVINYFDPKINERVRGPIKQFHIQRDGVECLDLTEIKNEEEFWKRMTPKK